MDSAIPAQIHGKLQKLLPVPHFPAGWTDMISDVSGVNGNKTVIGDPRTDNSRQNAVAVCEIYKCRIKSVFFRSVRCEKPDSFQPGIVGIKVAQSRASVKFTIGRTDFGNIIESIGAVNFRRQNKLKQGGTS